MGSYWSGNTDVKKDNNKPQQQKCEENEVRTPIPLKASNSHQVMICLLSDTLFTLDHLLFKLDLSYRTTLGDEQLQKLCVVLKSNSSLCTLKLQYTKITDAGTEYLANVLKSNTTLSTLDLKGNKITEKGIKVLCGALSYNSSLKSLNVSNNQINDTGMLYLNDVMQNCSLEKLNISGNPVSASFIQSLLTSDDSLPGLQKSLTYCQSTYEVSKCLTKDKFFLLPSRSSSVDLSFGEVNDSNVKLLSNAIKVNSTLTSLILRGNTIGPYGTKAICDSLSINKSVKSLDLGANEIGDEGISELAKILPLNSSIESISLQSNRITDAGADQLIQALKTATCITHINLMLNPISQAKINELDEIARQNMRPSKMLTGIFSNSVPMVGS